MNSKFNLNNVSIDKLNELVNFDCPVLTYDDFCSLMGNVFKLQMTDNLSFDNSSYVSSFIHILDADGDFDKLSKFFKDNPSFSNEGVQLKDIYEKNKYIFPSSFSPNEELLDSFVYFFLVEFYDCSSQFVMVVDSTDDLTSQIDDFIDFNF